LEEDPGGMVVIFAKSMKKSRKKIIPKRYNLNKKGKKIGSGSKIRNNRLILQLKIHRQMNH